MEVAGLCAHIFMNLFFLLAAQDEHNDTSQKDEADFLKIVPDRLQFFEYESVSVQCEVVNRMKTWRVMKKLHGVSPNNSSETCNPPEPSCLIYPILERHSGEYWCEHEGEVTSAVNISVTAGLVILDVPARPVMEGSDLTLGCSVNKKTDLKFFSDFYKDGVLLSTSYKSSFTIQNVSRSDEGLYRCSISGEGESPESWLDVLQPETGLNEEMHHLHIHPPEIFIPLCVMALLMVVIGLVLYRKCKGGAPPDDPEHVTYSVIQKKEPHVFSAGFNEEEVVYSLIH